MPSALLSLKSSSSSSVPARVTSSALEITGKKDPWTPGPRVDRLQALPNVEKVVALEGTASLWQYLQPTSRQAWQAHA